MTAPAPLPGGRQLLLLGSAGLLGSAIAGQAAVKPLRWAETCGLGRAALEERVRGLAGPAGAVDVVFASGLTDPRSPLDELRASNLEFPQRLVAALEGWPEARFLTFGSVFEHFDGAVEANPYYRSKRELADWMRAQGSRRFLHLRLHTLYGERLNPRMFLGQMVTALRAGQRFAMTSGRQFREYHHAADVAASVVTLCRYEWPPAAVQELSSGRPIRLADLARAVFAAAGRPELLDIGALPHASGENMERVFEPSPPWLLGQNRDPIPAICALLDRWLSES